MLDVRYRHTRTDPEEDSVTLTRIGGTWKNASKGAQVLTSLITAIGDTSPANVAGVVIVIVMVILWELLWHVADVYGGGRWVVGYGGWGIWTGIDTDQRNEHYKDRVSYHYHCFFVFQLLGTR